MSEQKHIWRIKVRRVDQPEYEIAEVHMSHTHPPTRGETIDLVVERKILRARIIDFKQSVTGPAAYEILATEEDDGNPPGHREATAEDFE
jgi:hypothetical protein